MKKQDGDVVLQIDSRIIKGYDTIVEEINALMSSIREALIINGQDATDKAVLSCAFVKDYINECQRQRISSAMAQSMPELRELIEPMALQKVAPLAEMIEDARARIERAGFIVEGKHYALHLKVTDFESVDEMLRVSRRHRDRFIDENTIRLTEEEKKVYWQLVDILPQLAKMKEDGWEGIAHLIAGRIGKNSYEHGVPGTDRLAEDVKRYHLTHKTL